MGFLWFLGQGMLAGSPEARLESGWLLSQLYFNTVGSLALLGDAGALEHLLSTAKRQDAGSLRGDAATQLGRVGGEEVVRTLATVLRDPDRDVRWSAIAALGATRDPEALRILESAWGTATGYEWKRIEAALKAT
ncbi:MAG: HEAT repeat domain-containing protein [Longimicrobiales bacterium]|nr:HEAT repeat domain-containing protein [Longimicrobiales bacterium]